MTSSAAAVKLLDLVQSHRITDIIYVAAKLGLAELLHEHPLSLDELAGRTSAHKETLERLMTALATIGLCTRRSDGRYELTDVGSALDGDSPFSVKGWAMMETELVKSRWARLHDFVMTGKTTAQLQGAGNSFDLMARSPQAVATFNAAMADLTRLVTPGIIQAYDFGGISHLLDVGGGAGELIGAVAKAYPRIRGTVFDLERCADAANSHLKKAGVSDRTAFVAGDFFKDVPAIADAIIMKSIIHDWDDERSRIILANCRKALSVGAVLLLVERIMPQAPSTHDDDRSHALSDLNMLCGPGGRERTREQYERLLSDSGFRLVDVYPAAGRFSVIEARAG